VTELIKWKATRIALALGAIAAYALAAGAGIKWG
jgi:hypothetical protein